MPEIEDSAQGAKSAPLPTEPVHHTNRPAIIARRSVVAAGAVFVLMFLFFWGPFYLVGAEGQLFLYPLALPIIPLLAAAGIVAVVFGNRGLQLSRELAGVGRGDSVAGIAGGFLLVCLPLPTLWFGGTPPYSGLF